MKREFGTKLIEEFFPTVDLTHVIDTSGAYIPGHGTPTVILVGRRRYPKTETVRAVLGVRGESSAPTEPANGLVWTSIVRSIDTSGAQTEFVTVVDLPRERISAHPWALQGAGASDLLALLAGGQKVRLASLVVDSGAVALTRADEAFVQPAHARNRRKNAPWRDFVVGEDVRDWGLRSRDVVLFPYADDFKAVQPSSIITALWALRGELSRRIAFGKSQLQRGLLWTEFSMLFQHRLAEMSLRYADVATHNHFARSGGVLSNSHAPALVIPDGNALSRVLGLLNSSAACFWLKQVSHGKGNRGGERSTARFAWKEFYEFTGTKVQEFPLPDGAPLDRARALDRLAQELSLATPSAVCADGVPTRGRLAEARAEYERIRGEMIALQEELDWEVYRLYGILDDDLTAGPIDVPELRLGERAFEIVLARKVAAGGEQTAWFERHRSTPITDAPAHWPAAYRELVEWRITTIEEHPLLHLVERPECKRRWAAQTWEDMQSDALRDWVLDRFEAEHLWSDDRGPRVLSVAALADAIRANAELRGVLDLLVGKPDYDLATELSRLVKNEAVPYLAAHRYKEPGLRKRAAWEQVWALQRREDAGETVEIPVPPKYTSTDFKATAYWRNRGKLDVPKERFILYPGAGRDGDKTPVLGWAGWDHLHQAQALARLVLDRQSTDGWDTGRIEPLLAGLVELEPWLGQWHHEYDAAYGGSPADFYRAFLDDQLHAHGRTRDKLAGWRP